MNYIDALARDIYRRTDPDCSPSDQDMLLYRMYALLCLTAGRDTTNRMVHDAWAAWTATYRPHHRSLVPFDALTPDVQELDSEYRDAIRAAAEAREAV